MAEIVVRHVGSVRTLDRACGCRAQILSALAERAVRPRKGAKVMSKAHIEHYRFNLCDVLNGNAALDRSCAVWSTAA